LMISLTGFISNSVSAQANKKKPLKETEKKVTESIKDSKSIKKEDDTKDADDDDKPDSSENAPKEKPYFKVVAKGGTPLRDKPKPNGKKLINIPEEIIGEVLDESKEREVIDTRIGNWLKVEYNGKTGWIFSGFTIVKEDKEDFLPLTLLGYFLIKSSEPIFYRKPGREILGVMPDYPQKGEIVPVYRKKKYYENEYYYFELKSLNPNSEDLVVSWVGEKSGNFLSEEAFSAYTLRSRKKKLKGFEMDMVEHITKLQSEDKQAINYAKIEFQPVPFKEKSKKKKAYILGYPVGTKTKKGLGNFQMTYYLVWKEADTYHSLLAGDKKNLKILDIDKDGNPEIFAQFETRGEPPLCHIYVYNKGMFEQLFPNYLFCDTLQLNADGNIEIQKEKEKILYKYSKGNLEKIGVTTLKPTPVPIKE
jgi:hypothetical protein